MDFEHALRLLKHGQKLARKGWNGKGLFVYRVFDHELQNDEGFLKNFLVIKNKTSAELNTWVPSISDLFAEDWEVVE